MAKRKSSALRIAMRAILWPCCAVLLLSGALVARMAAGPVEVPVPERALAALMARAAPGWVLQTSGARFDLLGTEGLSGLTLSDVRLTDEAGNEAVRVPVLGLRMALSATREAVAVRAVRLADAHVDVTRNADGGFALGMGGLPISPERDGASFTLPDDATLARLPVVLLEGARLTYRDAANAVGLEARSAEIAVDPAGRVTFDMTITPQGAKPVRMVVAATLSGEGGVDLDATFDDLDPAALAAFDRVLAPLSSLRMPLAGSVQATLAADGTLRTLSAGITAPDGGTLMLDGSERRIERLAATVVHDGSRTRASVTDFAITDAALTAEGVATVERSPDGSWTATATLPALSYDKDGTALSTGPVAVALHSEDARIGIDDLTTRNLHVETDDGRTALAVESLNGAGAFDRKTRTLRLGALDLRNASVIAPDGFIRAASLSGDLRIRPDDASIATDRLTLAGMRGKSDAVSFDAGRLSLSGALKGNRTRIDTASIDTFRATDGRGRNAVIDRLSLSGDATVEDGKVAEARIDTLKAARASLTLPKVHDAPLTVDDIALALSVRNAGKGNAFELSKASATFGGIPATATATGSFAGDGLRATVRAKARDTSAARVLAVWPKGVAPGGYRWASKNLHGGKVTGIALDAAVDTADPASDALLLEFGFDEAVVTAIPGLAAARRGRGRAKVTLDRLDVSINGARVDVPGAPGFAIGKSRFSIPDFGPRVPDGEADLTIHGPAPSILRFLDHDPIALISKSGFDIDGTQGQVAGTVKVRLPLAANLDIDDVTFRADAEVTEFALREPNTGTPVTGDTMRLTVEPDGLKLRADARVDGLSARLTYEQEFAPPAPGEPEGALTMQSYLTREDFALRAGVDVSDFFDGVAVLDTRVDIFPGGGTRFAADADLTGSTLRLDRLGWRKEDGVPATVTLNGFRNPDGAGQVERILLGGAGIAGEGRVSFDPGGAVRLVEFGRIALAGTMDAGLRYSATDRDAGLRIELSGPFLDLRVPVKAALDASAEDRAAPPAARGKPIEIATDIATLRLRDDLAVAGLRGGVRLRGSRLEAANVTGRLNGVAPAQFLAERRADGLVLRLTSEDAGAFLDAAGAFEGAAGGALRLDARTRDTVLPPRIAGTVRVNGITVRESETMGAILSRGAAGSLARRMLAGGLTFDKVELPFKGVGGRWTIAEGVAWGDALGLTLDGTYDIDRKAVDLTGTISPAYAINGALGAVPLLGTLLTGGEGEGVFGLTFAVRGGTDDPDVWVNPLSAIAPGFLRKIVSGVMDGRAVATHRPSPGPPGADR